MLRDQIKNAMKDAMKAGEKERLATLRLILAAVKDKDVEVRVDNTPDTEAQDSHILKLMETMVKQRRQSIELYQEGGRSELVEKELAEIKVIQEFLPKQLSEGEVEDAIKACIESVQATSIREMGAVIACLKEKYTGQMDFGKVSAQVKTLLGS